MSLKIIGNSGKWDKLTKPRETTEHRKILIGLIDIGVICHRLKKQTNCKDFFCKENIIEFLWWGSFFNPTS